MGRWVDWGGVGVPGWGRVVNRFGQQEKLAEGDRRSRWYVTSRAWRAVSGETGRGERARGGEGWRSSRQSRRSGEGQNSVEPGVFPAGRRVTAIL